MISNEVYQLCAQKVSLSDAIAESPRVAPGSIAKWLFKTNRPKVRDHGSALQEDLDRALKCGNFGGTRPSDLFLRAFHDVLGTLDEDPWASCVSPALIGTCGVVPVTIVGILHDIVRHMSNLIVRAKYEVLLATNYWMFSGASELISDALKELSNRAGERGDLVAVRLIFDRGNAKQVFDDHQLVSEDDRTGSNIRLPSAKEIPNIDMLVVNYHKPVFGTFHSKFMVVDRIIGLVQSNNIQDNDNLEMAIQLEGPVVNSLWEMFLVSWSISIGALPCMDRNVPATAFPTFQENSFKRLFTGQGCFSPSNCEHAHRDLLPHIPGTPRYDLDIADEILRTQAMLSPQNDLETPVEAVTRHLSTIKTNDTLKLDVHTGTSWEATSDLDFFPTIPIAPHDPVPMAIVSRKPFGRLNHSSLYVPQNEAFLSLMKNANQSIFIQTPNLNASPLYHAILNAVRRGVQVTYYVCLGYNDNGELLPGQNGINESFANSLCRALEVEPGTHDIHSAKQLLRIHYYVARDQERPIHNKYKLRSCHIKLLIVDHAVAIQGSANQDTQSWFHSQEVNIMVDSPIICNQWRKALEMNQNTGRLPPRHAPNVQESSEAGPTCPEKPFEEKVATNAYGRADDDGYWRCLNGNVAEGSHESGSGTYALVKGLIGAYRRGKGQGGF